MTAAERVQLAALIRERLLDPEYATVPCARCGGHVRRTELAKKGRGRHRNWCKGCESDRVLAYYHRKAAHLGEESEEERDYLAEVSVSRNPRLRDCTFRSFSEGLRGGAGSPVRP